MKESKFNFSEVTRESAKAAVASGMTPEDFRRESGLPTIAKLYAAIRGLYEKKAYAEKLIEGLKANKKKPVMAAPVEAEAAAEKAPVEGKKTAVKPATAPVAEAPAQDITKPQKGAPENPASDPKFVSKYTRRALKLAAENGCVVDSDYIVNFFEELKKLPMEKVFVPRMVLNNVRSLIQHGRVPAETLADVEWLEKNAQITDKAPSDIVIVDSSVKPRSVLFAKHVVHVRNNLGHPKAIALTKSYEVRNLLSDYEAAHQ